MGIFPFMLETCLEHENYTYNRADDCVRRSQDHLLLCYAKILIFLKQNRNISGTSRMYPDTINQNNSANKRRLIMEINRKKIGKYVGAACAATGVVAISGLVASGAAVGAVVEGFKSAAVIVKDMMKEEQQTDMEIEAEKEAEKKVEPESVVETVSSEKENVEILGN